MTGPSSAPQLRLVVADTSGVEDLHRCVRQALRSSGALLEVLVVSARSTTSTLRAARQVCWIRVQGDAAVESRALELSRGDLCAVVVTSRARFQDGWAAAALDHAAAHPETVGEFPGCRELVRLVPAGVDVRNSGRTAWATQGVIRLSSGAPGPAAEPDGPSSVSAVMIVKDEEAVLGACLDSLLPFVDEVVVYDTGSTDRTGEVARSRGAVVVAGYWDDHFGDARNRALAHATGTWVLQVDADDVVTGDAEQFRRFVAALPHDQAPVPYISVNADGSGGDLESRPIRLFKRGQHRYAGALHEYVETVPPGVPADRSPRPAPLRLLHSGHQESVITGRGKSDRNLRIAEQEMVSTPIDSPDRARVVSNYGRSLLQSGEPDEALNVFAELLHLSGNRSATLAAARQVLPLLAERGRLDEAERWIPVLETTGESRGAVTVARAAIASYRGDLHRAADLLNPLVGGADGGADIWGIPFDPALAWTVRMRVDMALGVNGRAADDAVRLVRDDIAVDPHVVLTALAADDRPLCDLVEVASPSFVDRSLRAAARLHPAIALQWYDALRAANPGEARFVAVGALFAARFGWQAALQWTGYARELGLEGPTALHRLGEDETAPASHRAVAWALLADAFSEHGAAERFEGLLASLPEDEALLVLSTLTEVGVQVDLRDEVPQPLAGTTTG